MNEGLFPSGANLRRSVVSRVDTPLLKTLPGQCLRFLRPGDNQTSREAAAELDEPARAEGMQMKTPGNMGSRGSVCKMLPAVNSEWKWEIELWVCGAFGKQLDELGDSIGWSRLQCSKGH